MQENCSEDEQMLEEIKSYDSVVENLPNFAFPNLKDDPDLQMEFNIDDTNTISVIEYLDEAITSNFETLEFKWRSECLICSERFEEYQDLLHHCSKFHLNEFDEYACTLEACDVMIPNEKSLARHLVLRHSDLESIKIYGSCPLCGLRFSKFSLLNKHSCYNKLARKACEHSYCQFCKEEFVSHKRFLFHLQFHLAKRRAKVCLICDKDFTDVDEFFVHVNYAHEPPQTLACTICDRKFLEKETYIKHQKLHELKAKYKCDECNKSYHVKRLLVKHKQDFHTDIEFKCDLCPKVFPNYSILQNHLKWHNTDAEVHVFACVDCGLVGCDLQSVEKHTLDSCSECFECVIEEEILTATYSCHFCAQDFKDKNSLKLHRATGVHENGKFHCAVCDEILDDQTAKRIHMMSTHKNYKSALENLPLKRLWMCDVGECEECYNNWTALQRHKSRRHNPNACQKCKQILANADELESHIKQCQANAFICQFCDKVCPTKMSLAVHVARTHNKKQVTCPHCGFIYKDEKTLQEHVDYRHVPVPCTDCEKVLSSRQNLEIHLRVVHESEQRYFCVHCDKGFYHRSQKKLHEENVHPDAIYKCGECNFTTKYAKSLKIHVAKHLEKSEFKCPHCRRSFGRKSSLVLHIKRHQGDKPFKCSDTITDGCDAAYITRYLLSKHIISKHSAQSQKTKENKNKVNDRKKKSATLQKKKIRKNNSTTAAAISSGNVSAAKSIVNSATATNDVLLESQEVAIADTEQEDSFIDDEALQSGNDENYMLLLVDDEELQIVNTNGEFIMLDDTEIITV